MYHDTNIQDTSRDKKVASTESAETWDVDNETMKIVSILYHKATFTYKKINSEHNFNRRNTLH